MDYNLKTEHINTQNTSIYEYGNEMDVTMKRTVCVSKCVCVCQSVKAFKGGDITHVHHSVSPLTLIYVNFLCFGGDLIWILHRITNNESQL